MTRTPEEIKTINQLLEEQTAATKRLVAEEQARAKAHGEYLTTLQKEKQERDALISAHQQASKLMEEHLGAGSEELEQKMQSLRASTKLTAEQERQLKLYDDISTKTTEEIEKLKELHDIEVRITTARTNSAIQAQRVTDQVGGLMGVSNAGYDSLMGNIITSTRAHGSLTAAIRETGEEFGKAFVDRFGPMNLLNTIMENTLDFALQMDNAASQFVAATGASREYGASIRDLGIDMMEFGVDIGGVAAAYTDLYQNFTSFSQINKEQQEELGRSAALMQKLGIDASVTGELMDSFTKGLGMGFTESRVAIEGFATEAAQLGIAPAALAKNFTSLMPKMAAFGRNAKDVFLTAAKTAKALGLEVQELLAITDQFDTFDAAAEKVGGLNAVLGGTYLDTVSMVMETDPTKRIIMMKDAFDAAGRSVADLEYYEKKALAVQMGFGDDVNAFSKAMNASTTELMAQNAEQATLEQLAQDSTNVMDKLSMAMNQFMVTIDPVVDGIRSFTEWLMKASKNETWGWIIKVAGYTSLLVIGLSALFAILAPLAPILGVIGTVLGAIATAFASIGTFVSTLAAAMAFLGIPLWAVVGGFVAVGAAIVGLVVYWDEVVAAFSTAFDFMGNMFNNFVDMVVGFGPTLANFFIGLIRVITTPMRTMIGLAISGINMLISGINLIPGVSIPEVPSLPTFAKGVTGAPGGFAIVGEKGPEIVEFAGGENVMTNENTEKLVSAVNQGDTVKATASAEIVQLVAALKENTNMLKGKKGPAMATAGGPPVHAPVVLQLNEREIGRAIDRHLENKHDLRN